MGSSTQPPDTETRAAPFLGGAGRTTKIVAPVQADPERLSELLHAALERNRQPEYALESRIVIEQAKGVLIERLRLVPDEAFTILRRAARSSRLKLHELAGEVVGSRTTPPEVTRALAELARPPARRPNR